MQKRSTSLGQKVIDYCFWVPVYYLVQAVDWVWLKFFRGRKERR
jgi:hypothetical protein